MNNLRQADVYPKRDSGEPRLKSTLAALYMRTSGKDSPQCCAAVWCFSGSPGNNTTNRGKETVIVLS